MHVSQVCSLVIMLCFMGQELILWARVDRSFEAAEPQDDSQCLLLTLACRAGQGFQCFSGRVGLPYHQRPAPAVCCR